MVFRPCKHCKHCKNDIKLGKDDAVLVVRVSVEGNNRTQSLISKDSIISRVSSGRTNMDNMGILCKWQQYNLQKICKDSKVVIHIWVSGSGGVNKTASGREIGTKHMTWVENSRDAAV